MKKEKNLGKVFVKILKNKGQALVEFAMILPILIMILFVVIDFASIFYNKNHLEGVLNDVVLMVENDVSKATIEEKIDNKNITYEISRTNDGFVTIKLEQKINFITPFSNLFFKEDYKINTKRVIIYE